MNTDVEDLLRQGMLRYTAELRAPAGMVRVAERRRKHRRLAQRSVTAMAALAACALVVLAVATSSGAHRDVTEKPTPTIDTAYLIKRVASALSAAGSVEIAQLTVISDGHDGTTTASEWSYGDQWRSVVYAPSGQPIFDAGGTSSTYTLVNYSARTWARQRGVAGQTEPPSPRSGCEQASADLSLLLRPGLLSTGPAASSLSASVVKLLRTAISCGTLTEAGQQHVDGIAATKLTSSRGSLISETIWVSPTTYLPIRVVIRPAPGSPAAAQAADITWLKPSAQNRAALTVPIPAGFRQVPFGPNVRTITP